MPAESVSALEEGLEEGGGKTRKNAEKSGKTRVGRGRDRRVKTHGKEI